MVAPSAGAVVLVPFPFSDLSRSKLRPAVILAGVGRGDYVLCQVTSNPYSDPRAVPLSDQDFRAGSLRHESYARPGKLFTANRSLLRTKVGDLKDEALQRLVTTIVGLLQTGTAALQLVVDTNVVVSALRSRSGASFELLSLIGRSSEFEINVSVPLVLEYEDAAKRQSDVTGLSPEDVDAVVDYICSVANRRRIYYLWRPFLKDPKDDMVLELAVEAQCELIVSYNKRDFEGVEKFGCGS